jgi:CBS domain containing-hemolysin-like protein
MMTLILIVVVTLAISSMCSLFEAALYSTRTSVLEASRSDPELGKTANRFLSMKRNIARPTAAILILNTVANTAGATLAGMYAARELGVAGVPLFSVGLTLSILFFAEILPKTYGAVHWRQLWARIANPLHALEVVLSPAIAVTQKFSSLFTSSAGSLLNRVTEEEILAMIRIGTHTGDVTRVEQRLLHAVFEFDELVARQVMLPREEIIFLRQAMSHSEVLQRTRETRHTRFPLVRHSLDDVLGVLHVKDLLLATESTDWAPLARPIKFVPESTPLPRLLRQMQSHRQHMAMVIDEHGTVTGLITLENVLEQIVGTVQDEFDEEEPPIVTETAGCYLIDGSLTLNEINRELGLSLANPNADRLSGLLVRLHGRLLSDGDIVEWDDMSAEVLASKKGRALRVRLTIPSRERD